MSSLERIPVQTPSVAADGAVEEAVITVTINGRVERHRVDVRRTLADFIREDVGLTGTHLGCEHGICGACTVNVEGETVRGCLMLAVQADGKTVKTIEGMPEVEGELHPIQQAFWNHHGLQCGFCTPGMVIATEDFLKRNPNPTREEVREGMAGNLCRCTGYQNIVDSIMAAAEQMRTVHHPAEH